jgi:glycosyltransferase involved in cell wall biosynthesis
MTIPEGNLPFFSIIIATYNREGYLPIALNSIFKQEFKEYEIIVVDDGSTDNTREVISELIKNNPCIKYFFKKNEERSIARNYGIMKASGKYIGFLDSDDILYPNHMTVAHELLKKNNFPEVGHLACEVVNISGDSVLVKEHFDETFKEKLIHENIIHINEMFIRRDVAKEVNFIPSPAAVLSEDWYLWLRLAARYPFHFDNTITSAVVQHNERSLMKIHPDKLIASTNIIVEYLKRDQPFLKEYKNMVSYHFANHYTFLTLILALNKSRRYDTIRYMLKAVRYDPTVMVRKRFLATIKHLF